MTTCRVRPWHKVFKLMMIKMTAMINVRLCKPNSLKSVSPDLIKITSKIIITVRRTVVLTEKQNGKV